MKLLNIIFKTSAMLSWMLCLAIAPALLIGCKKGWLDAKSDIKLITPSNIKELQGVLDNTSVFNINHPSLGEIGSDNYYLLYNNWNTLVPKQKNGYIWADDVYAGVSVNDWDRSYQRIYYANTALDGISQITPSSSEQLAWNNVKGTALFYRSVDFYNLVQLFAKSYDLATANTDLSIPLRLTQDVNKASTRATVQQAYDRIITDLQQAATLLPGSQQYATRPSKAAAFALLARTFLSMHQYDKALQASDSSLSAYSTLLDYNQMSASPAYPFPQLNSEVLFVNTFLNETIFGGARPSNVDTTLYASYAANDLRKSLFFTLSGSLVKFRGSYRGSFLLSGSIAVDEVYLTRAECYARKGNISAALSDLNTLLINRWKSGTFVPVTATDATDALNKILTERRKELIFRGIRWTDIRRLNDEGYNISISRNLNGQFYNLQAKSNRFVWPIPVQEIQSSGIEQNSR